MERGREFEEAAVRAALIRGIVETEKANCDCGSLGGRPALGTWSTLALAEELAIRSIRLAHRQTNFADLIRWTKNGKGNRETWFSRLRRRFRR